MASHDPYGLMPVRAYNRIRELERAEEILGGLFAVLANLDVEGPIGDVEELEELLADAAIYFEAKEARNA